MNIGILLAAGRSSRFGENDKQLYEINGKSIISFSIDLLSSNLDELVIVANSTNVSKISNIVTCKNVTLLVNDIDSRIRSIGTAIYYLSKESTCNIIIHDAARPFITQNHIDELLATSGSYLYAQYYLGLTNGLAKATKSGYEIVDRSQYIELCTPLIANYKSYSEIFKSSVDIQGGSIEVLPILCSRNMPYKLIEGSHRHLRKITTIEDTHST